MRMRNARRRRHGAPAAAALPLCLATLAGSLALHARLAAQEADTGATELRMGRAESGSLAPGDTARYWIATEADEFLLGSVNQLSVDASVRVLGPGGAAIASYGALGAGRERFAARTSEAGTHTVELTARGDDSEGGMYELVLARHEPVATDPARLAEQVLARYDADDSPGAAVRAWRDGRTLYSRAVGMANLAYGIPFEEDTRTNIGSTSKQFTAFAIMLQAERGLLALDDDIRKHVPELPKFDHPIRVEHLLTHVTGLREFLNLLRMTGRRTDHGDWIDRREIIDIVKRQPALQNVPGAEYNYNNTAFGLAAVIVERTSGQPFHEFMRDNVFGPLGMARSMVRPTNRHIVPDASEGYTPGPDGYRQIGDLGGAVGAGAVYASIEDLQTWIENYADPSVGTREGIDRMMRSFVLNDGEPSGYGLGLRVDEQGGLKRVSHGGADVAHRSMLVYFPEINAGITTQSNHAEFNSGVAYELAAAFFKDAMTGDEEEAAAPGDATFDPESYAAEAFDELAGRYALNAAPDFILAFSREGDRFYVQATGQQRLEIVPTSDSTFRLLAVEASVTFHRDGDGAVTGLTLHQNGDQPATRLPDDEEAEGELGPDALSAFAGRYFGAEIETYLDLAVEDGELVMRHRRLDRAALEPAERDRFSGGGFSFHFERDRNGRVIGFYLSNVRTRDVRFARQP